MKLSSHGRKVEKFGRAALEIKGIVAVIGLSPLIECSLNTDDMRLIFAFAESDIRKLVVSIFSRRGDYHPR